MSTQQQHLTAGWVITYVTRHRWCLISTRMTKSCRAKKSPLKSIPTTFITLLVAEIHATWSDPFLHWPKCSMSVWHGRQNVAVIVSGIHSVRWLSLITFNIDHKWPNDFNECLSSSWPCGCHLATSALLHHCGTIWSTFSLLQECQE